jgi:aminopeptidase N
MAVLVFTPVGRSAVSPYSRTKDYQLKNVKTRLKFDTGHREVMGDVTHSLSVIREGITALNFDCSDLTVDQVTLDGKVAEYANAGDKLSVTLARPAKRGDEHTVEIRYHGSPKKGLYFILPDKDYPDQPIEVWSQGEDEDTHYYIPIYDYPNNRTTSEMILTVPAGWVTISNGKLASVKSESDGMKTWDWRQSEPIATYLISVVAGQFDQKDAAWRDIPLNYLVPKGQADKTQPTFVRTPDMLSAFSDRLGVLYPWTKYAQSAVNDFVVGGMENASATTLTTRGLVNPAMAGETPEDSDGLVSHEMAHQWFGDLVTCKDWADLWLNEGFATYFEHYWNESHYGQDAVDYEFWRDSRSWFRQERLFPAPIVNYAQDNSLQFGGNIYTKGGLVLRMLREKLGDTDFFGSLKVYLDTHRYKNVATADLVKSIEETSGVSVDEFFHQWVFGAGAPKFNVSYEYDAGSHQLKLTVKQTQKVEGRVGLFHVPIQVEVGTDGGQTTYPIDVQKAEETFTFTIDGQPRMVIFDKGNQILKSMEFKKTPAELMYQLQHAETVPDRADAATALGEVKDNLDVTAALGHAAVIDAFWGVRQESLNALGAIGGADAEKQMLAALGNPWAWVRQTDVEQLGHFPSDDALAQKLEDVAQHDKAWRVRGAALESLGEMKAPGAYAILETAAGSDSPDGVLRNAAMRGFGSLADDKAVPLLQTWAAPGKPIETRTVAISSLSKLDKKNKQITRELAGYLQDAHLDVQRATFLALALRGDKDAIPAMEAYVKSDSLSIGMRPMVERMLGQMKEGKPVDVGFGGGGQNAAAGNKPSETTNADLMDAIQALQKQVTDLNQEVRKMQANGGAQRP